MKNDQFQSCMICKHFFFDAGDPGYSDWTPGYEAEGKCQLGVWSEEGNNDWISLAREHGKGCSKFCIPDEVNVETS